MSEEVEETGELPVGGQGHGLHFRRIGANLVTKNIVGRQADDQEISRRASAQSFVRHQLSREFEFVVVGERRGTDYLVETGRRTVFRRLWPGRARGLAAAVLPF